MHSKCVWHLNKQFWDLKRNAKVNELHKNVICIFMKLCNLKFIYVCSAHKNCRLSKYESSDPTIEYIFVIEAQYVM